MGGNTSKLAVVVKSTIESIIETNPAYASLLIRFILEDLDRTLSFDDQVFTCQKKIIIDLTDQKGPYRHQFWKPIVVANKEYQCSQEEVNKAIAEGTAEIIKTMMSQADGKTDGQKLDEDKAVKQIGKMWTEIEF